VAASAAGQKKDAQAGRRPHCAPQGGSSVAGALYRCSCSSYSAALQGEHKLTIEVAGDECEAIPLWGLILTCWDRPGKAFPAISARSEVQKLCHSSDLTILNVIWAPHMTIMPHNHQMWAVIGIYTGREDNIFWRRVPGRMAANWKL